MRLHDWERSQGSDWKRLFRKKNTYIYIYIIQRASYPPWPFWLKAQNIDDVWTNVSLRSDFSRLQAVKTMDVRHSVTAHWRGLFQAPEMALALGYACGLEAAGRWAATSRIQGSGMRETLPALSAHLLCCVVVGGEDGDGGARTSCEQFCPSKRVWRMLPPMQASRAGCAVAALNNHLYVVGGEGNDFATLSTVERLDLKAAAWYPMPPMSTRRAECAAVVSQGRLLVIGGRDDMNDPLDCVERFDPNSNLWESLPPLRQDRYGCAAGASANSVWVVGGMGSSDSSQLVVLDSVECVDNTDCSPKAVL